MDSVIRGRTSLLSALIIATGVFGLVPADTVEAQNRRRDADAGRITDATNVLVQIASMEDKGIPRAVLQKAAGIIIFPRALDLPRRRGQGPNTLKTARLLDIRSRGIFSARNEQGAWSPPAFLTLAGGTPPDDADLVLVVVNRSGLDNVMRYQFDIGATPDVAPGPVGNDENAWTDVQRNADILTYSLARGSVTGISLSGSVVQGDTIAHQRFYGKSLTTAAAIAQTDRREPVPAWHSALEKNTSR
jgi:SH3 domain-containing YSC84-like protein 1